MAGNSNTSSHAFFSKDPHANKKQDQGGTMEHTPYDDTPMLPEPDPLHIQTTAAIGKTLLKGLPRMNKSKMKLIFVMLEHINWREYAGSNIIVIDNQLAKKRLGWNIKSDATVANRVRDGFKSMITECMVTVQTDKDAKGKTPLILDVYGNTSYTAVAVNPAFMGQMSNLPDSKGQYFQFDIGDIMGFRSQYSIYLYMELRRRKRYKPKYEKADQNPLGVRFQTKQLKDIMGLDREDYTSGKKNHFNRSKFEKEVLEKPLEEISHSRMIELCHPPEKIGTADWHKWVNALWYSKEKRNGHVKYYHIHFRIREGLFDTTYGRYVNNTRFNGIAQGFAPESEKQEYRTWLDGISQASVQEMEIPNDVGDDGTEKL